MSIQVGNIHAPIKGQKGIDVKATGATLLLTTSGNVGSVPSRVAFAGEDVNTLTVDPVISIGTNSPDYNDIVPDTTIDDVDATSDVQIVTLTKSKDWPSGTGIYANVKTAAVATTYLMKIGVEVVED